MPNAPMKKRFEEHALQRIASTSNPNEQERRLAEELLEARNEMAKADHWHETHPGEDYKTCAARCHDIAYLALLPER